MQLSTLIRVLYPQVPRGYSTELATLIANLVRSSFAIPRAATLLTAYDDLTKMLGNQTKVTDERKRMPLLGN